MQIFYDSGIIRIEIPVDYDKKSIINRICNIALTSSSKDSLWSVEGLFLNHAVEEEEILTAQKRLEVLYHKKCEIMNIANNESSFQRDRITVTKAELIQYFSDFANCYMEITVRPQESDRWILELGTEADASYIYVCINENGKTCLQELIKYIGIEKLSHIQIAKKDKALENAMTYELLIKYPEIKKRVDKRILEMEKEGWVKSGQYIQSCFIRQEKVLVYELKKMTGEYMKLPVLRVNNHSKGLDIRFEFKYGRT